MFNKILILINQIIVIKIVKINIIFIIFKNYGWWGSRNSPLVGSGPFHDSGYYCRDKLELCNQLWHLHFRKLTFVNLLLVYL
jgi:hypothetical protein